jgi:ribokinase
MVVIVGSSILDLVFRVGRFPRPGETVTSTGVQMFPGGKGANQAVAAARMGHEVAFLGCVGNDTFGERILTALTSSRVNVTYCDRVSDAPTGVASVMITPSGQNQIVVEPGANRKLSATTVTARLRRLPNAKVVVTQLETPVDVAVETFRWARERRVRTLLNPAPAAIVPVELLALTDFVTPNESECEAITGHAPTDEAEMEKAADILHAAGVANVVITLGERGAYWSNGRVRTLFPAPEVRAVDTVGAGDTLTGILAAEIASGSGPALAVRRAVAGASLSVSQLGAQSGMPTLAELRSFAPELF